jgi:PPE-SVP subfamily C-terminal region
MRITGVFPVDFGKVAFMGSFLALPQHITTAEEGGGMTTVSAGMPAYASAGRGSYGMGPRYGVKPTVMPTKVLV